MGLHSAAEMTYLLCMYANPEVRIALVPSVKPSGIFLLDFRLLQKINSNRTYTSCRQNNSQTTN